MKREDRRLLEYSDSFEEVAGVHFSTNGSFAVLFSFASLDLWDIAAARNDGGRFAVRSAFGKSSSMRLG